MDAIELLEQQHREVEQIFKQLEKDGADKAALFAELADSLAVHATIEEKIFYPATKSARTEDLLLEAVEEHLSVKRLLADMLEADPSDNAFDAKIKVLKEQIEHHVEEEEEELFPKVKKQLGKEALAALGQQMEEMGDDLKAAGEPRQMVPSETEKPAPL